MLSKNIRSNITKSLIESYKRGYNLAVGSVNSMRKGDNFKENLKRYEKRVEDLALEIEEFECLNHLKEHCRGELKAIKLELNGKE